MATALLPLGGLTAGGDVAAGVSRVDLRDRVGAVLRALGGTLTALLGLADDAASTLQADAVLAVELEVLPKLQEEGGERGEEPPTVHQCCTAVCLCSAVTRHSMRHPLRALWGNICPPGEVLVQDSSPHSGPGHYHHDNDLLSSIDLHGPGTWKTHHRVYGLKNQPHVRHGPQCSG